MESFVSLSCVLGFIGFINGRFVHSRAPWRRWVHPWSVGSIPYALGVVWFIRGHWVHYTLKSRSVHLWSLARALASVWFIWGCSVHSRAPWRSMGSLAHAPGVAGFIRDRWVHSCSPLRWMCSSMVVSFNWVYSCGRRVHPGYLRSLRSR